MMEMPEPKSDKAEENAKPNDQGSRLNIGDSRSY